MNLWEVIGHLWWMGFSQENSAFLACLCDFLRSVQLIVVILVPNGRLFRYLHLGMWFVILVVCGGTGGHSHLARFLSRLVWGSIGRLLRHTELFRYVVFAQFCVFKS